MPFIPDPSASGAELPPARVGGFTPDAQAAAGPAAPAAPAGQIPGQSAATLAMVPPEQEPEGMPDWMKQGLQSATAVPGLGLAAGGIQSLFRASPTAFKLLQTFERTAPQSYQKVLQAIQHIGKGAIPASGKELAMNTGLAGTIGAGAGLARQPLTEALTDRAGLPESVAGPLANVGLDIASIGAGMGAGKVLSGGNVARAKGALTEGLGDLSGRLSQRARDEAFSRDVAVQKSGAAESLKAAEATRVAKLNEATHAKDAATATQAAQAAADASLTKNVAAPATADDIGGVLKDKIGARMGGLREARTTEGRTLYTASNEAAKKLEAAGNSFDKSVAGRALVRDLEAMKAKRAGLDVMTPQQQAVVDDLIKTIQGGAGKATTQPLGAGKVSGKMAITTPGEPGAASAQEALVTKLRELRKANERPGTETTGYATLGKRLAQDIGKKFDTALYSWNPAHEAADKAYKAASEKLLPFKTEGMSGAVRGEPFDYEKMAASPAEFGGRFFKDGQSVRQLREATGDPALVSETGAKWAAQKLQGMNSEAAGKWARDNADWLKAAEIDGKVAGYVKELAGHEQQIARTTDTLKQRGETLAGITKQAQGNVESATAKTMAERKTIEANKQQRTTMASRAGDKIMAADPKEVMKTFRQDVLPELKASGLMGQNEIDALAKQVEALQSTYQGYALAKKIALTIGLLAGGYQVYKGASLIL